ncbi:hypothetical protein B9479_008308 [Cryptococcus floricola]|uniref:Uncharacterized protein n=1 Tax=Cryptococcus floricola TaxID=2591691 RepID=A0A5D3AHS9_9TREE|nr:hypothetical protein B9479_008308 [Cryptococcus floricola]
MAGKRYFPRPLTSEEFFSTPYELSTQRLTYDLLPNAIAAEKHALRLFKTNARDQIWNLVEMSSEMEAPIQEQLEGQLTSPQDIEALGRLVKDDGFKQNANRKEPAHSSPIKMHLPPTHAEHSIPILHSFIRQHPLGIFTTALPNPSFSTLQTSHVPFILDVDEQDPEDRGRLRAHMARANPQAKAIVVALV